MNFLTIQHTATLSGQVTVPGSKSQSIRGLLLGLLSEGRSVVSNILDSEDTQDAMGVCEQLGARLSAKNNQISLESQGTPIQALRNSIYTGNSGITTLFTMPILGLSQNNEKPFILNCGEQMRARPVRPMVDALRNLGLEIQHLKSADSLPVSISGHLRGGRTEVEGNISQYLSALLMSLPCASENSEIIVENLNERSYVDMTLRYLNQQKIIYQHERAKNRDIFYIQGNQKYQSFNTNINGDFSSASYLIAAAVLTQSRIRLQGLDMQDVQGDKRLINILQDMGADIVTDDNNLIIQGGKTLKGISIDASDIPDLLPILAVIGTQAEGRTDISQVGQARLKETDRIHSMTEGLSRMGAKISENAAGLSISRSKLQAANVRGYGDHRTVMALSIAGLLSQGETVIDDAQAIQKTFPGFINLMQSLGANMEVKHAVS